MSEQKVTSAINTAVIVIGGYHMPASVAFGAAVGASLFILSREGYPAITKAWLFAVAFISGIFGGDSASNLIDWVFRLFNPNLQPLHLNDFLGAAIFSALVVVIVQRLIGWVSTAKIKVSVNNDNKDEQAHD